VYGIYNKNFTYEIKYSLALQRLRYGDRLHFQSDDDVQRSDPAPLLRPQRHATALPAMVAPLGALLCEDAVLKLSKKKTARAVLFRTAGVIVITCRLLS
jgi:hypothetical protein